MPPAAEPSPSPSPSAAVAAAASESPSTATLVQWLQRAQAVAAAARAAGHHPFGAVLIDADGHTVLLEQGNVSRVEHAESELAREAYRRWGPARLAGCTLVTTVEPCAMCAGTQYWAGIGRLVYGLSESRLRELTGADPENPTLDLPCREVFATGAWPVQVIGPVEPMRAEIESLHAGFWRAG